MGDIQKWMESVVHLNVYFQILHTAFLFFSFHTQFQGHQEWGKTVKTTVVCDLEGAQASAAKQGCL